MDDSQKLYPDDEVSTVLPSCRATRQRWRTRKEKPLKFILLGNRIYYKQSFIDEFLSLHERPKAEKRETPKELTSDTQL